MPRWSDALVDASGDLVTYSEVREGTWKTSLAFTSPTGAKLKQVNLAFRPASMAIAPGGGVILLDSKQVDGSWQSEAFLVDTSGSAAAPIPVPSDTVRLATNASGSLVTVGSDGSIQTGTVGSGAFRTISTVSGGVTEVVLRDDGTIYTCGASVNRIIAGTTTALRAEGDYCLGIADDEANGGVVVAWYGGKWASYRGDGTSVRYGLNLMEWWNVSDGVFDVLTDGDLIIGPRNNSVLYRFDIASGRTFAIGAATRQVKVTTGGLTTSGGFRPVFAVDANDSVYVSEDTYTAMAGPVARLDSADSLSASFAGYPSIVGAKLWNDVGPVYPAWTGEMAPTQFTIVSGKLPFCMNLDPNTGEIYGFPSERGVFTVTIAMANPGGTPITSTVTIDVESRRATY